MRRIGFFLYPDEITKKIQGRRVAAHLVPVLPCAVYGEWECPAGFLQPVPAYAGSHLPHRIGLEQ